MHILTRKVLISCKHMHRVKSHGTGSQDKHPHAEHDIQPDALCAPQLQVPREDDWHDIQDEIVYDHNGRVDVREEDEVDAVAVWDCRVPCLVDRRALKNGDEDRGESEAESDEVHRVCSSMLDIWA